MIIEYLNDYFKKNEITQREIEQKTGISQSKLSMTFTGQRKLTAEELVLIAIKFDLDLNKIKELHNNESSSSSF